MLSTLKGLCTSLAFQKERCVQSPLAHLQWRTRVVVRKQSTVGLKDTTAKPSFELLGKVEDTL